MSGAPAAARSNSIFLCVVRWFTGQLLCAVRCAPDRHYRLSGAPISRFKKGLQPETELEAHLFSLPALSLCPLRFLLSPVISHHQRPPSPTVLRRPRAPLLPSSVSSPSLPQFSSLSILVSRGSHFHPFCPNSKSCEILCIHVVVCVSLCVLSIPAGF
jgi:hypothetical protein